MVEKQCCETPEETMVIFACAGASNVGQMTNEAARLLDAQGVGRYFCLAGIAARVSGMMESTKAAGKILALDGCAVACARKTLKLAGFRPDHYLQVTDQGIEKDHNWIEIPPGGVKNTVEKAKKLASARR